MAFRCPRCGGSGSLGIALSVELPPDSRSDEISLQLVACSACGFAGLAVYEESRRGSLGDDSFHHTGYRMAQEELASLAELLRSCPHPQDPGCLCPAHRQLGRRDAQGTWDGLAGLNLGEPFPMHLESR